MDLVTNNVPRKEFDESLIRAYTCTREFLTRTDGLVLTRADKGNVTVALYSSKYLEKMTSLLEDTETYKVLLMDPTKKVVLTLQTYLNRWKKEGFISKNQYKQLKKIEGNLPRAYGLPKIHKNNWPLRIIVSTVDSPLYDLATFLHKIILDSVPRGQGFVLNSFDLVKKLSGFRMDNHLDFISLDVTSLFTNIPRDLALESIKTRWKHIKTHTRIPIEEFISAIAFVLDSTHFIFNNIIYCQVYGTPMGSPLSPIIADLVMQDIENRALQMIKCHVPFYFRYVDDILMAIPPEFVGDTVVLFNSLHPRLKFTSEVGLNKNICFLDISLKLSNGIIECDWYHKPTFSGRYLNFCSHHPLSQKKGVIYGLVDKAFLLSHPKHHTKNLKTVTLMLLDNGYPLKLIFHTVKTRLQWLIKKYTENNQSLDNNNEIRRQYSVVPYINGLSEKFRFFGEDRGLTLLGLNKLNNLIVALKDRISKDDTNSIVYRINCADCNASYVGQTKRKLKTRIIEHCRAINRNVEPSVVTTHRLEGHEFEWDKVEILDKERSYAKRLISEMVHIRRQVNSINRKEDTQELSREYSGLIERMSII